MICQGEDVYQEDLKEMWKQCFPADSESFIRFYFDEIYRKEEALVFLENEKPAAFLHIIPYQIKTGDGMHHGGYLSGVMTHPNHRKKGYMEKLLSASFERMQTKGYDYVILIPQEEWLLRFYAKYGFRTLRSPSPSASPSQPSVFSSSFSILRSPSSIYPLYLRFIEKKENTVVKTEQQFALIFRDFLSEQGVAFASEEGMAFTLKKESRIVLKEIFYTYDAVRSELLTTIRNYYHLDEIVFPNENKGMIKCLNPSVPNISNLYMGMMLD
ncbi:MAG: GNAT family N-acetyltransferase [Candidatus Azobacteroides sp.]|nr:GNAT family N-acetyltransferase [Candidatus Azobacteroides sp.]